MRQLPAAAAAAAAGRSHRQHSHSDATTYQSCMTTAKPAARCADVKDCKRHKLTDRRTDRHTHRHTHGATNGRTDLVASWPGAGELTTPPPSLNFIIRFLSKNLERVGCDTLHWSLAHTRNVGLLL